jgi:hypothetical protein
MVELASGGYDVRFTQNTRLFRDGVPLTFGLDGDRDAEEAMHEVLSDLEDIGICLASDTQDATR